MVGTSEKEPQAKLRLALALQGGGSHGAFGWGVLHELLEEPTIEIAALSGTSAGAVNAVIYADGWLSRPEDPRRGAQDALARTHDAALAGCASECHVARRPPEKAERVVGQRSFFATRYSATRIDPRAAPIFVL